MLNLLAREKCTYIQSSQIEEIVIFFFFACELSKHIPISSFKTLHCCRSLCIVDAKRVEKTGCIANNP